MRIVLALVAVTAMTAPAYADHVVLVPPDPPPAPLPQQPLYVAADPTPNLVEAARYQRAYDRPERPDDAPDAVGFVFTGGWAAQHGGPEGWVGRIDAEVLTIAPPLGESGGVFGTTIGFEYWQATPAPNERDFGMSMPMAFFGGVRGGPLRIVVGGGFDGLLVDHVAHETGFGMYAPFALAQLSVDDGSGWRLGVDARVGRRWELGADDHTRYQLGVTLARSWDNEHKTRHRAPVATAAR